MSSLHAALLLGLVVWNIGLIVSTQPENEPTTTTNAPVLQHAERRMGLDVDDNLADSTGLTSYSSVVIHHPGSHKGQTTSQWTIEDHNTSPNQRSVEADYTGHQQFSQPTRRHRTRTSAAAASQTRDEVTAKPESLSTATTFFRMRGHKSKSQPKEDTTSQNGYYEDGSSGHYMQSSVPAAKQTLPPGMTQELISSLLNQQPQTFDYGYKSSRSDDSDRTSSKNHDSLGTEPTSRPSRKPQKKYRNQIQTEASEKAKKRLTKNRDSFNVGYSIGFGTPTPSSVTEDPSVHQGHHQPNDVVLGKPKSLKTNYKLHVNGETSIWKELQPGVEMSEETMKNSPLSLSIPEKTVSSQYYQTDPEVGILSGHPGQSVYYINGGLQQDYNVPTTGQATFDHDYALGQSNTFDFSNAVSNPLTPLSPQSKQDSPINTNPAKHIQPIQFKHVNQQNAPTTGQPQKVMPFANQAFPYLPYSLESFNKPTQPINPKGTPKNQLLNPANLANGYDLSQYMGFGTPVPIQNVYIPGKSKDGDGQMVPAIVIPISQLSGFENFGPGLNYVNEGNDGFQSLGGDVFNVVPQGSMKEAIKQPLKQPKQQNNAKFNPGKPHLPRLNDKQVRGGKGIHQGMSSLINLSAPDHLDSRPYKTFPNRRPFSGMQHKILAPKFSQPDNFRDSPAPMKRSPSNRNARLAQLQTELNSILAEEMYRKNRRPHSRRQAQPHHIRMF